MINWDGHTLAIEFEIWRIREAVYKLINRLSLFFGRGWFWVDCGYCRREHGRMKCGAGPSSDETCVIEECRIFCEDDEW